MYIISNILLYCDISCIWAFNKAITLAYYWKKICQTGSQCTAERCASVTEASRSDLKPYIALLTDLMSLYSDILYGAFQSPNKWPPGPFMQMQIFFDKKGRLANIRPSLLFYGIIILVKTIPLCRGMAWLPFKKSPCKETE